MVLPVSGSITAAQINVELGRSASAGFSMDGAAERYLAGKPSGSISFEDFHGKRTEIVVDLSDGGTALALESLFSAPDWISETPKRVVVPEGVERGNAGSTAAALVIGATGWGGALTLEVRGTVSGKGGAANSGTGGNAVQAERTGSSGQKLQLLLSPTGVLRGGGGGGGGGGTGGGGAYSYTATEGPHYNFPSYSWTVTSSVGNMINWASSLIGSPTSSATSFSVGSTTYHRGSMNYSGGGTYRYAVSRAYPATSYPSGGAGGNGGLGEGYGQPRTGGVSGTAGGTNAGTGGTGGTGGLYGAVGFTGSTGNNGNHTNGLAGAAGGQAGFGLLGVENVTLINNGTILGRTG